MKLRFVGYLFLFVWVGAVSAAVAEKFTFVADERIEAEISGKELNRIRIAGDRIKEVIGLSEDFIVQTEPVNGQIFIQPGNHSQSNEKSAIFSVVTENGRTQDFRLEIVQELPGQVITVEIPLTSLEEPEFGVKHPDHQEIIGLIKRATNFPLEAEEGRTGNWQRKDKLSVRPLFTQNYSKYQLEIWEVRNKSDRVLALNEKQFYEPFNGEPFNGKPSNSKPSVRAIALEQTELAPNSSTKLYKVKKG